ncbi:Mitogen-activated protein kinase homolog NTF3-like protein [Drosera capensis]
MLVFYPTKRISVTDALKHPYMAPLYDPWTDPPAQFPIDLDIDEDLDRDKIREMIWNEILYYHPDAECATAEFISSDKQTPCSEINAWVPELSLI